MRKIKLFSSRANFITVEISKLIDKRDKAYRTARRTKIDEDWTAARALKDRVRRDISKAKKDYVAKLIDQANGDSKKFWRILGETPENENC